MIEPTVIYEDNHLLVIDKPSGIATAGVADSISVYSWAQDYIKKKYNKPGNVYIGVVSRLDTVTSGALVLARTSKAAARLSEQLRLRKVDKTYFAVLEGHLELPSSENSTFSALWVDQLYKDDEACRMRCVPSSSQAKGQSKHSTSKSPHHPAGHHAQEAKLVITVQQHFSLDSRDATLVSIQLLTGRKHQIRVQCSARGHAVWGDKKYGAKTEELSTSRNRPGIALHAAKLTFAHPTRDETLEFNVPPPASWEIFSPAFPRS